MRPKPLDLRLLVLAILAAAAGRCAINLPECKPDQIDSCGQHQLCDASVNRCQCSQGYVFDGSGDDLDSVCVPAGPGGSDSESGGTPVVIVTLFVVLLLGVGAVLFIKRKNIADWFRDRFSNTNNVILSEEFMIGQDDPPLTA